MIYRKEMRQTVAVESGRASLGGQSQRKKRKDTTVQGSVQAPCCGVDLFAYGGSHGGEYE